MATKFYTYDADQVSAIICGIPIDGGYADGAFIKVETTTEAFTTKVGTGGDVTRSKTGDNRARITVTLLQQASANGVLSALHNLDKAASNGAGVGPSTIKDRQGTALHFALKSWIVKRPDATFDREDTPREWVIECADMTSFDGGQ